MQPICACFTVTHFHKLFGLFGLYRGKMISGFAIGHPGQCRVPLLVPNIADSHTQNLYHITEPFSFIDSNLLQEFFGETKICSTYQSLLTPDTFSSEASLVYKHLIRYSGHIPDMYVKQPSALDVMWLKTCQCASQKHGQHVNQNTIHKAVPTCRRPIQVKQCYNSTVFLLDTIEDPRNAGYSFVCQRGIKVRENHECVNF